MATEKYLIAVSGGIDSVVLLDMLANNVTHKLVVAHFDHGIRSDSADDARFVEGLAKKYELPFVTRREKLGEKASEELARKRRYAFLRQEAKRHQAMIMTAHHQDDICETIAINLERGTGWRGLAVLDNKTIIRPLLGRTKAEIRDYALRNRLEWVEDSSNATNNYLRNRLRRRLTVLSSEQRQAIIQLWYKQITVKSQLDATLTSFITPDAYYSRHFLIMIDQAVGTELLRAIIMAKTGVSPTRPQLMRALLVVKTARPGTIHHVGASVTLHFTRTHVIVQTP